MRLEVIYGHGRWLRFWINGKATGVKRWGTSGLDHLKLSTISGGPVPVGSLLVTGLVGDVPFSAVKRDRVPAVLTVEFASGEAVDFSVVSSFFPGEEGPFEVRLVGGVLSPVPDGCFYLRAESVNGAV